jgi:AcrR family transcriptional regulator
MICKRSNKDGAYEKLIETGVKLFGKYGYDGVSTRQISKDAKVNIAAVCYHFGGKKKFYEEVVGYLTDEVINFINQFDIKHFDNLPLASAKTTLAELIHQYQNNFISTHGIYRLNIFMHEAFGQSSTNAHDIYTNSLKFLHDFFHKVFKIYFTKAGKDLALIDFSIALIHGIIQAYVITNKTIAPPEIKLGEDVLLQSIKTVLD